MIGMVAGQAQELPRPQGGPHAPLAAQPDPSIRSEVVRQLEPSGGKFQNWLDNKLKISALLEMTKSSELEDDWQWLQDNAFEFQSFYDPETIAYVCNIFSSKWIRSQDKAKKGKKAEKFERFADFMHTSPLIIQIFDRLCYINNSQLDTFHEAEELTLEDLKSKADELLRLLSFLEIFAYNKMNLEITRQIHGVDCLVELLKCYGNKIGNDELLIEIETRLLKCLAIVLRSDKIGSQFLADEEETQSLTYVIEVVDEQLSLLKWSQDVLQDHMVDDTELLEGCFITLRQLIIGNRAELLKVNEDTLLFVDKTLEEIIQKLDDLMSQGNKEDLRDRSLKARRALSSLILACVSCLLWSELKPGAGFTVAEVKQQLSKIEQKHPRLRQRLRDLRMAEKDGQVVEAIDNDLDSACTPQRLN